MQRSWKQSFYILWVAQIIAIVGFQSVQPFLPYYIQELNVDSLAAASVWAGYLGTIHGFAMALSAPLWGALADRLGRRPMVVRSMVGGGITVLLMAYVVSVEQLLVVRFLHGVLSGSVTASITLVSTTTPKQHLAFALGMMQTAFMFGGALGALFGGPSIDYFGYHNCFIAAGLLVVVAGILVQTRVEEDFRPAEKERANRENFLVGAWRIFGLPGFPILLVCLTLSHFTFGVSMPVTPLFLQQLAKTEDIASIAGPIFAFSMLVGGVASAAMGKYSDRIGARQALVGSMVGSALFFALKGFSTSVGMLAALMILSGLVSGAMRPVTNVLVTRIVPAKDRGVAFGVITSASALGWGLGPALGGYIGATLGFRAVFFITAAIFLSVALWSWGAIGRLAIGDRPGQADAALH